MPISLWPSQSCVFGAPHSSCMSLSHILSPGALIPASPRRAHARPLIPASPRRAHARPLILSRMLPHHATQGACPPFTLGGDCSAPSERCRCLPDRMSPSLNWRQTLPPSFPFHFHLISRSTSSCCPARPSSWASRGRSYRASRCPASRLHAGPSSTRTCGAARRAPPSSRSPTR